MCRHLRIQESEQYTHARVLIMFRHLKIQESEQYTHACVLIYSYSAGKANE